MAPPPVCPSLFLSFPVSLPGSPGAGMTNFFHSSNKETGKVVWETNISDGQNGLQFTAAPLAVKDKIVLGASGGDNGVRTFILALDAGTGKRGPVGIVGTWPRLAGRRRLV